MLLGLIADIHADARALEAALRHLEGIGVDQVLCSGDLVGYGSQPEAAVALLRDRAIPCILGNHDRWALERRRVLGPRGWKPAAWNEDTWEFLRGLPPDRQLTLAGRSLAVYHGSPASDTEYVSPYKPLPPTVDQFWAEGNCGVLILGHTHIPMIHRAPRGTIINPGSILGVPGVPTSYSFAVVDLDLMTVRIHDVRTGREIRRDPVFNVEE